MSGISGRMTRIFCLLCLSLSPPAFGQHSQTEKDTSIDWSRPETIDPLREDVGDFLDVDLDYLRKNAYSAYESGDYQEAARRYLVLLRYDIHDVFSIYNLACCYGLLGKVSLAARYLARAAKAGFEEIEHLNQDPDFERVRGEDVFDAVVDTLALQIEKKQKALGDIIYVENPALFRCRVHLPGDYDPTKSYPLVVGLHGRGLSPERFITLWQEFEEPEFIYASPQAPYAFPAGTDVGYSWKVGVSADEGLSDRATEMSVNYIAQVVQDLSKRYNADGAYLLGFSQGAAFAYYTGIKNPQLLKGLICFGGWLNTDWLEKKSGVNAKGARELRIFTAHGREDEIVKYEEGTRARDILKNHGYDVTFFEFEGGHTVPKEGLKQVVEWLKRPSKG